MGIKTLTIGYTKDDETVGERLQEICWDLRPGDATEVDAIEVEVGGTEAQERQKMGRKERMRLNPRKEPLFETVGHIKIQKMRLLNGGSTGSSSSYLIKGRLGLR